MDIMDYSGFIIILLTIFMIFSGILYLIFRKNEFKKRKFKLLMITSIILWIVVQVVLFLVNFNYWHTNPRMP